MSINTKVIEGIYYLKLPLYGVFSSSIIVVSKELALIDTGMHNNPEKYIFPFIRNIGRRPEEISLIINTHSHADHAGGNPDIKKISNVKVAAHELAVGKIPGGVDEPKKDGDILEVGEFKFRIIHTPGHCPDAICFLELNNKVLISGDAIQGNGDITQGLPLLEDIEAYRSSLRKLLGLDFQSLILGHKYTAKNEILFKRDAKSFIEESLEYSKRYEEEIIRMLKAVKKPLSQVEIHRRLLQAFLPSTNELIEYYLRYLSVLSRTTIDSFLAQKLPPELKNKVKREKWEDVGQAS